MRLTLNQDSTPEEIGAFEHAALKAGRPDLSRMAYAVRMIRDANALESPIPIADRHNLALHAFAEAVEYAKILARQTGQSDPLAEAERVYRGYAPQYIAISSACLNSYHDDRLATLRKSKSGKRQLATARATVKALSRLEGRYHAEPLRSLFDRIWTYWKDQAELLAQYAD